MNLKRWSIVLLMLGLFLVLSSLAAQAEPPFEPYYHHPHGNAYGWHGPRPHDFDRCHRNFRRPYMGPRHCGPYANQVYAGPPTVAYVAPVTPMIGLQAYPQAQPYYTPPAAPGLHGQITF